MIDDIKIILNKLNPALSKVESGKALVGLEKSFHEKLLNTYSEVEQLVIVRLDAIGDCLLFSNSMKQIRKLFPNAAITYVCYYETHDLIDNCPYIDTKIYMDRTLVNTDKFYREKVLAGLQQFEYDLLINPLYSREFQAEEIVQFIKAKIKIGVKGDHSNIDPALLNVTEKFYDVLLATDETPNKFELYRNAEIIKLLGGDVSPELLPEIWGSIKDINFISNFLSSYKLDEYAVVFPGSKGGKNSIKYWGSENFAAIIDFIQDKLQN